VIAIKCLHFLIAGGYPILIKIYTCMPVHLQVKAALFAAGCICRVSEDFSRIMLEVFRRLICSRTSEPQVIMAAIKAFSKLDCTLAVIHRVHEVFIDICLLLKDEIY